MRDELLVTPNEYRLLIRDIKFKQLNNIELRDYEENMINFYENNRQAISDLLGSIEAKRN